MEDFSCWCCIADMLLSLSGWCNYIFPGRVSTPKTLKHFRNRSVVFLFYCDPPPSPLLKLVSDKWNNERIWQQSVTQAVAQCFRESVSGKSSVNCSSRFRFPSNRHTIVKLVAEILPNNRKPTERYFSPECTSRFYPELQSSCMPSWITLYCLLTNHATGNWTQI